MVVRNGLGTVLGFSGLAQNSHRMSSVFLKANVRFARFAYRCPTFLPIQTAKKALVQPVRSKMEIIEDLKPPLRLAIRPQDHDRKFQNRMQFPVQRGKLRLAASSDTDSK